ncbi:putative Thioesterase domain-containing protein [Seiridium unicorne]|uniref:Thioesterase domain-containing protein n=1 Tax=Seiridium unicorne TaxID=138068 RepID=A0ABR2VAC8_9PEZI
MAPNPPTDRVLASANYFKSIPWCAARLDSTTEPIIYYTVPKEGEGAERGDKLWVVTLNTEFTIPHLVWFYATPAPGSPPDALIPELQAFLELGPGVNGFPGYAHGGFVCALLDEITGLLCSLNRARGALDRKPAMTGFLNTRFLKPVKAPGVILARARITRAEGRKTWVEGWVEDEAGQELSRADVMFVNLKGRL